MYCLFNTLEYHSLPTAQPLKPKPLGGHPRNGLRNSHEVGARPEQKLIDPRRIALYTNSLYPRVIFIKSS